LSEWPKFFYYRFFILFYFVLQNWIPFKIKLCFVSVLSYIGLSYLHDPTRGFWQPSLVLLVLFLRLFLFFFFQFHPSIFWFLGIDDHCFFQFFLWCGVIDFFLFFKIQWQLLSFVFLHCRKFIMVRGKAQAILHPCPDIGFGYPIYCSHVRINIVITYFWLNYQHIE
jgi:hypothetical protein